MANMPRELISDILARLSVQTLCRFKSVCKDWLEEISDSHFRAKQYHKAITNVTGPGHPRPFEFVSPGIVFTLVNQFSSASLEFQSKFTSKLNMLPDELTRIMIPTPSEPVRVLGPCKGVYFVHDYYGNCALWNHATREYNILLKDNCVESYQPDTFGFGSEDMADGKTDFVVVGLYAKRSYKTPKLYKLSDGLWRDLNPLPKEFNCDTIECPAINIDGVFYWLDYGKEINGKAVHFLISFDMRTKTFGRWDLPELLREGPMHIILLGCTILNGKKMLSLMVTEEDCIWTMGKDASWIEEAIATDNPDVPIWAEVNRYEESLFPVFNKTVPYRKSYKDILVNSMFEHTVK